MNFIDKCFLKLICQNGLLWYYLLYIEGYIETNIYWDVVLKKEAQRFNKKRIIELKKKIKSLERRAIRYDTCKIALHKSN